MSAVSNGKIERGAGKWRTTRSSNTGITQYPQQLAILRDGISSLRIEEYQAEQNLNMIRERIAREEARMERVIKPTIHIPEHRRFAHVSAKTDSRRKTAKRASTKKEECFDL